MRAWIEPLGWMLVHSVWLISVIVGVAAVALSVLRRRSANARYLVGCVALVLSVSVLPGVFAWVMAQPREMLEPVVVSETQMTVNVGDAIDLDGSGAKVGVDADPGFVGRQVPLKVTQFQTADGHRIIDVDVVRSAEEPEQQPPDEPTTWQRIEARLRPHLAWLVSGWLAGVCLLSLRPLIGWRATWRLRRVGLSEVPDSVSATLHRLAKRLGLRRMVKIIQSSLVQIPFVVGALKPVILLPASALFGLSPEQLEALLAHELAHIRRHDFAVNIVQTLVETLLFYHPAIWWLSRRVRQEREHCCDDLAISVCGDVASYARMLVSVEGLRGRMPQAAVAASGGSLVERIRRLLPSPEQNRSPWMTALVMLVTLMLVVGSWQWTVGQNSKVPDEPAGEAGRALLPVEKSPDETGKSARPTVPVAETSVDGSQTRLIVEWSAVVDGDIVQSIRQLKPVGGKSQLPMSSSVMRCSADELRGVIRQRLGEHQKVVPGTYAQFVLPTPPGFRTKRNPWDRGFDVFDGERDVPLGEVHVFGTRSFEDQENVAKLRLDCQHRFTGNDVGSFEVAVQFNDSLNNGEALAVTVSPKINPDAKAAIVCVYESLVVPAREVEWMRRLSRCDDWIRLGPAGMKQRIERAADWRSRATKEVRSIDPNWTRDLPNGGHVQLVALSRPAQAPLVWWTPDGKAISGLDLKSHLPIWVPEFWALVRVWEEGARRDLLHVTSPGDWKNGVQELPIDETTAGSQFVMVPAALLKRDGRSLIKIGTGFGPWTAETRLDATAGASATLGKLTVKTEDVFEANVISGVNLSAPRTLNRFHWTPLDDTDVTILAVRQKGRLTPEANPLFVNEAPKHSTEFEHAVSKEAIEHFIVKTRPRSWAEFTGFAIEPAEPLNPPLDFGEAAERGRAGVPVLREQTAPQEPHLGALSGRFVYDGEPPVPKDLYSWIDGIDIPRAQRPGPDGRYSGVEGVAREFLQHKIRPKTTDSTLLVGKDGGIANVIVSVVSKDIPWTPPKGEQPPVTIRLKDGNYAPRFTAVLIGQPLLVENHDPVAFHFSAIFVGASNPSVNWMLRPGAIDTPQRLIFREPERNPSPYRSNIGPWATGFLLVRGNPFVAISQPDGSFSMPNLPPGEWEFRAWHERKGYLQHWPKGLFKHAIKPGDNNLGTIKLKPELFVKKE